MDCAPPGHMTLFEPDTILCTLVAADFFRRMLNVTHEATEPGYIIRAVT